MDNCYSGGGERVPREDLHSQDDRLTNKHVKTLAFLQEMAKENKQLKQRVEELEAEMGKCKEIHALAEDSQARIQEIQEKYLTRADEINQMLAEKHRAEMMEVLDEKMESERTLKEEILKLRHEIESLQRTNVELREEEPDEVQAKQKLQDRIQELELMVEGLQIEVKDTKSEKDNLRKLLEESQAQTSELHKLQEMRTLNQSLSNELQEANQKNLEYVYRIEKLEKEMQENSSDREQTKLIEAMRNKMEKLAKQKEFVILQAEEVQAECDELKNVNELLNKQLQDVEEDRAKLVKEHGQLCLLYGKLQKRVQNDEDKAHFKEFVALKRELVAVKNENEILKLKVRTSAGPLPVLREELPPPPAVKPLTKRGKKKLLAITLAHGNGDARTQ